ncbi:hypothetical protein C8R42DRAFT_646859 [Lentinula raphanica]|nr:hypothetical protein C8R42DRAFT_646859 [Lentinula raphanica]
MNFLIERRIVAGGVDSRWVFSDPIKEGRDSGGRWPEVAGQVGEGRRTGCGIAIGIKFEKKPTFTVFDFDSLRVMGKSNLNSLSSWPTSSSAAVSYHPYLRTQNRRQIHVRLPTKYNPDDLLDDRFASFDPVPNVCRFYEEQVRIQFAEEKRLATFDLQKQEYVEWTCKWQGLEKMAVALKTGQVANPPLCHHILNLERNRALGEDFCHMYVKKRHVKDTELGVTGYLTPESHDCIWHPIYPSNERPLALAASSPPAYPDVEEMEAGGRTTSHRSSSPLAVQSDHRVWANSEATFQTDAMVYTQRDLYHAQYAQVEDFVSSGPLFSTGKLHCVDLGPVRQTYLFSAEAARDRRLTDIDVVKSIIEAANNGEYIGNPRAHPAFDISGSEGEIPDCFVNFTGADAEATVFNRCSHLRRTAIGIAILQLNSIQGISLDQFAELRKRMHKCISCYAYFSFDGYQLHLGHTNRCHGTPEFENVPSLQGVMNRIPELSLDHLQTGVMTVSRPAAVDPVGLAWLTWNSYAGVTHDTWVHMITAWRRCDTCAKVRSFQGHLLHLKQEGICGDEGDEALDIIGHSVLRLSQESV